MKQHGYAGRRFVGRRRQIDNHTAGMPSKHEAWPGVQLDRTRTHVEGATIKKGGHHA